MKACLGIISYLPDGIREDRLRELKDLLNSCSDYFPGIDIILISQNYKDYIPIAPKNRIILYSYNQKLGILVARKKLRELFINSDYDYLIMLDDDTQIYGEKENNFIKTLEDNPDSFACFDWDRGQLWMFAISKSLFKKVEYPELDAESGDIFEDTYLSHICREIQPNYIDTSKININRRAGGRKSTWWNNQHYNIRKMEIKTNKLIKHDLKYKYGTIKK